MQQSVEISGAHCVPHLLVMEKCPAGVETLEYMKNARVVVRINLTDYKCAQNTVPEAPSGPFIRVEQLLIRLVCVGRVVAYCKPLRRKIC